MKLALLVLMIVLVIVTPAIASHVPPSADEALNASLKRGEHTFNQDTGQKWRHARVHCRLAEGATVWGCDARVSSGAYVCWYGIRVLTRDSDSKVITRLRQDRACVA